VGFDPDKDLWGGKLALEYALDGDAMIYGSLSRGYRANGVNAEILASIEATDDPVVKDQLRGVREYDEEALLNYELGFKGQFAGNRLQTRAALFYMDREDQQVKGSFLIQQSDGGTSFIDYTDNAAEGNNYGAEVELNWQPIETLSMWLSVGWLETEYEDYTNAEGVDLSGRDQAQAPNYQYALGGRYSFTGGVYLQAGLEGKDGYYFSDRHDTQADAYDLLNARIGFSNTQWDLALWGRNLTDEDYYVRGFGGFGNNPRKDYAVESYYQLGQPRMLGITASYTF
jgi:iron complex outermembrane receptor protein